MKVSKIEVKTFWKGEVGVSGLVQDNDREYRVRLEIKGSNINSCSCSCAMGSSYKGLCPHQKALLNSWRERAKESPARQISTSVQVRNMIREYTNREMASVTEQERQEPVSLVPRLLLGRQDIRVEFRVGRERLYVLKDLVAFSEAVDKGSFVEYGKELAFYHSISAFSEDSREMLDMILELAESYREHYIEFKRSLYVTVPPLRQLNLSRVRRDRFLGLLAGREIEAEDSGGGRRKLAVVSENPELAIRVEKAGARGIRVALDRSVTSFEGEKHLYVFAGDRLYICDDAFSSTMAVFFRQMTQGFGAPYEVMVNEKDIPLFYERVLKKIENLGILRSEGVNLESYRPAELTARFVLESPDANQVILHPELRYGSYSFHPMEDGQVPGSVCRDVPGEYRISQVLTRYFKYRDAKTKDLVIRDDEEAIYRLLSEGIGELRKLGEVLLPEDSSLLKVMPSRNVRIGIQAAGNWLELQVDAEGLDGGELMKVLDAYREKRSYYRLKSGEFLQLGDNGLMTVARMVDGMAVARGDLQKSRFKVPRYRALFLDSLCRDRGDVSLYRDQKFKSIVRGMKSVEDSDFEIPPGFDRVLRSYQKHGFRWLKTLDYYGFGGILADDMGLGKTVQILSLLYEESLKENLQTSLIVCPASLVYNWEYEIRKFAPSLRTLLIVGTAQEREEKLRRLKEYDVAVTSYDLLKRDWEAYGGVEFRYQVIDEAQYIKNPSTQSAQAVKSIRAVTRFALTGTPIENRLSELWSIFDYLMPGFLYSYQRFKQTFEIPIIREDSQEALSLLRKMTGPFILRRLKSQVLKELPEKLNTVVYSQMEGRQRELYGASALRLRRQLEKYRDAEGSAESGENKLQILAALTRLRQLCCDPRLIYEDYGEGSAKLETCVEVVSSAVGSGYKILLFSQFTSMLELIAQRLDREQIGYYMLTGQTSKEERVRLVSAFQKDTTPVFLISLKAGGTGLNLTAADMVIHYDPWWNVAAQNQATDRTHRIGQTKAVTVVQLIARGTIEENILNLQKAKESLAEQVITGNEVSLGSLSSRELLELLE